MEAERARGENTRNWKTDQTSQNSNKEQNQETPEGTQTIGQGNRNAGSKLEQDRLSLQDGPLTKKIISLQEFSAPKELQDMNLGPSEDQLGESLMGPSHVWAETLPQHDDIRERLQLDSEGGESSEEDLHSEAIEILDDIKGDKQLDFLKQCSPHFSSFLKAFVVKEKLGHKTPTSFAIHKALVVAEEKGLPQLQEEDTLYRKQTETHNGNAKLPHDMVTFSIIQDKGDQWVTSASFGDYKWEIRDYGDHLSWGHVLEELKGDLNSTLIEKTSV